MHPYQNDHQEPRWGGRFSAILLALLFTALPMGCDSGPPRSVIIVTIDTMRADRSAAYGHGADNGRALERLANRGRRYVWAFSASSSTAPSHASIFTGKYPSWHTVGTLNGAYRLDESATTLAEIVQAAGYSTRAIVSNPVLHAPLGLSQGFDVYDDELEAVELNRPMRERYADRAVDLALEWLDEVKGTPFFLWLHIQDPHGPYLEHAGCSETLVGTDPRLLPLGRDHAGYESIPRYQKFGSQRDARDYRRRYDCEIGHADGEVMRLVEALDADELFSDTLISVTSDHGEALGEEGFFFAHGQSIGPDQVRVPLVLAGPGIEAGEVIVEPVSNVGLFATVLDHLGLPIPEDVAVPSLMAASARFPEPVYTECINQAGVVLGTIYLRQDRRPPDDVEFWSAGNPNSGGGFWKPLGNRIHLLGPDGSVPPGAEEEAAELLAEFERQAARAQDAITALRQRIDLTPEQRDALRSLGYID